MSGWGSDPWREEHQHPHRRNWLAESGGLTGCCVTTPSRGTASMGACCSGAEVAGILDLGGEGGGGEGCDGYPVCCCVVGIGRGSYRLQACQRLRKECWREKGDGLPFTGKQWAIYSPSDPPSPSPLPPSPSPLPHRPVLPSPSKNGRTREPTQGQSGGGEVRQSFWIGHRAEAIRRSPRSQVGRAHRGCSVTSGGIRCRHSLLAGSVVSASDRPRQPTI